MIRRLGALVLCAVAIGGVVPVESQVLIRPRQKTLISLWYRGMPAGTPRQVDLDAIRDAGFTAVTWPLAAPAGALELRRMADRAGLQVVIRSTPAPMTGASALRGDTHADIAIPTTPMRLLPAIMWRAVGHGSRVISFDAGLKESTGLRGADGQPAEWVAPIREVIDQLRRNTVLVDMLVDEPGLRIDPPAPGLDIVLLNAGRSWALVATNVSEPGTPPADTYAFLPRHIPPAEWLNLFDGTTIGMLRQPDAIRWHVVLGSGDFRVYLIDKRTGHLLSASEP